MSARVTREVSEEERRYENGCDPCVLDIVEVPLLAAAPHFHQRENWVLDAGRYWEKKGRASWETLTDLVQRPASLWKAGDSTQDGVNDRVSAEVAAWISGSLLLIEPEYLKVHVGAPGQAKRRVRVSFLYRETHYSLIVTDPVVERAFLGKPDGTYDLEEVYLCVSLTESWEGWCYKVVAGVIGRPG